MSIGAEGVVITEFTQEELNLETGKVSSSKLKLPIEAEIIGELLSMEELKESGITLLSVQNTENEVVTVSTSIAYWKKVGRPFVEGSIVKFGYETRIKGKTGYKSGDKIISHEADGLSLVRATKFSPMAYQRMLDAVLKETDIATLESVEVERVGAVAQYLGAYVSKR